MTIRTSLTSLRTQSLLASERARDPQRLLASGFKGYSQNDEDGILQEIFRRINVTRQTFVEFGAGSGTQNNTLYLLFSGWRGLWIECDASLVSSINKALAAYIENGQLVVRQAFVEPDSIDSIIHSGGFDGEIDLLSIDIDGNDYWVWNEISSVKPRVVTIEYNATFRLPVSVVKDYRKEYRWDGTNYDGASLKALEGLGRQKGYALVGCCLAGVNAFFVRQDLVEDRFCSPFTTENHYEPPRFSLLGADLMRITTPQGWACTKGSSTTANGNRGPYRDPVKGPLWWRWGATIKFQSAKANAASASTPWPLPLRKSRRLCRRREPLFA
jgi:hypothetical protein